MKTILRGIFGLAMAGVTVWGFMIPGAKGFNQPDLARILFFHLSCAIGCSVFLVVAPVFALIYLVTKREVWDIRSVAAMEIAFVLGVLTLLTGMIFSKVQWLEYWSWDPRQTSFLLVMLIVAAHFALRAAISDGERRAATGAAYQLAATLPMLFLIFVFTRLPQVARMSLHPDVVRKGGFDATYNSVFLSTFALILVLCSWIYRLRVRQGQIESQLENRYGELADSDRAAPTGVVRPVSVPRES